MARWSWRRCGSAPPGPASSSVPGEGVGTVTRPGLPLPPGEPAINPVPRADDPRGDRGGRRGRIGGAARCRGRDLDPRRRGARRADAERRGSASSAACRSSAPPASSCPIPARPGSTRSIAASTWRAPRVSPMSPGATGSTSEAAVQRAARPARAGADRHGRFRRRHAEISAAAPGAAGHRRGRLRQDDQARPGPARPAFPARRGRSRLAGRRVARRPAAAPSWRRGCAAANTALEAFATRAAAACRSATRWPEARLANGRARRCGVPAIALEIVVFDRDGAACRRARRLPAGSGCAPAPPPPEAAVVIGGRRARSRGNRRAPSAGPTRISAVRSDRLGPPRRPMRRRACRAMMRSSGQDARTDHRDRAIRAVERQ